MTANPFAALLDGVPRLWLQFGPMGEVESVSNEVLPAHSEWLRLSEVLAALSAAVSDDLAEAAGSLLPTLRKGPEYVYRFVDTDNRAADLITALLARIATQEAVNRAQVEVIEKQASTIIRINARAEAAETALAAMTKERDELATANHRQASCIHVTAANLGPYCSATVDGLPKAARHVAAERDALLGAVKGLVEVLDQHETKGPLPDVALMFCWLAAQNVRAALRGNTLEKPE